VLFACMAKVARSNQGRAQALIVRVHNAKEALSNHEVNRICRAVVA
jgi:hypothetical protein